MAAEWNEQYEKLAEFLHSIGWKSPCDAQWSELKKAMPQIHLMTKPFCNTTLEAAALHCEKETWGEAAGEEGDWYQGYDTACRNLANAIRDMKTKEPQ